MSKLVVLLPSVTVGICQAQRRPASMLNRPFTRHASDTKPSNCQYRK